MSARVIYNQRRRRHVVELTLDADEAENIAHALGMSDLGAQELFDASQLARARDVEEATR